PRTSAATVIARRRPCRSRGASVRSHEPRQTKVSTLTVSPARPEERPSALELALRHLPESVRQIRADNALNLLASGDIPAEGLLLARQGTEVLGVLMCLPLKGASGLFWPSQVRPDIDAAPVHEALIRHGLHWLAMRGARVCQALLAADEMPLAAPLLAS